jgi:hypothetical protein
MWSRPFPNRMMDAAGDNLDVPATVFLQGLVDDLNLE